MYDKQLMIDLFPYVLKDPKAAETFFIEAKRCFNTLIPTSSKTASLFRIHFGKHATADDYEDLLQTCLATLWERICEQDKIDPNKIDGYISSIARYRLLNQIYENSKPTSPHNTREVSERYENNTDVFESMREIDDDVIEAAKNFDSYKKAEGSKEVSQFSKQYVFIRTYNSPLEAAKATGIDISSITRCLNHQRKSAGGYIWLYSNDKICQLMAYE